jgi:hypothetical protein
MGQANHGGCACSAIHHDSDSAATRSAIDWLGLAATPAFALMALLASVPGHSAADLICSTAHGGSVLAGMVPMYVLMATFHSAPWLKLVSSRRQAFAPARTSSPPAIIGTKRPPTMRNPIVPHEE